MLKISESYEVSLPSFNLVDDLNKNNLLMYCLSSNLKYFFPDKITADSVSRSFILTIIHAKDPDKYKLLEQIARNVNYFKAEKSLSGISISVPTVFLNELERFKPNSIIKSNSRIYSLNNSVFQNNNIQVLGMSREEKRNKRKKDLDDFLKRTNTFRNVFSLENSENNIN